MPEEAAREAQEEEDDDFPELPNIEDFSFDGVLAGVGGKGSLPNAMPRDGC